MNKFRDRKKVVSVDFETFQIVPTLTDHNFFGNLCSQELRHCGFRVILSGESIASNQRSREDVL